ncbi:MAG: DUF6036 family nucleotidyltransferase [Candidatus Micrarchaeota archaeon]
MDSKILRVVLSKEQQSISELIKSSVRSTYACYSLVRRLAKLGIVSFEKGQIVLQKSPLMLALRELSFSGFGTELLEGRRLDALTVLLEPKTKEELGKELGLSFSQTHKLVTRLSQFLTKIENKYQVAQTASQLRKFLLHLKASTDQGYVFQKKSLKLLRLPREIPFEGTLTGFSRFSDYGVDVGTSENFIVQPAQNLSIEQVLVHALKFAQNANDTVLCIIFYLHNKPKISVEQIEKHVQTVDAIDQWQDLVAWLEDQPLKNPGMFLPKNEVREKAEIYHVQLPTRYRLNDTQALFDQISQKLFAKTNVYQIGGGALLHYGYKQSTKDIDIVVQSPPEAVRLVETLHELGFAPVARKERQYEQLETAYMLEKTGYPRIDLFVKTICNCLEYSPKMVSRSAKLLDTNLQLYNASVEDIFLLKSVSSRDSDLIDNQTILRRQSLDWKTIENEVKAQEKNLKQINELTILEHLETLEKTVPTQIPFVKKLTQIVLEKSILHLGQQPRTVADFRTKLDFPEYTIRNTLNRLVKEKKIIKKTKNRKVFYQTKGA